MLGDECEFEKNFWSSQGEIQTFPSVSDLDMEKLSVTIKSMSFNNGVPNKTCKVDREKVITTKEGINVLIAKIEELRKLIFTDQLEEDLRLFSNFHPN
jgi:hypothetical protein